MTGDTIRSRISSVCAKSPFRFTQAKTPFSFDLQPSGEIEEVFRVETESADMVGGFNYSETRTDVMTIWVARKFDADPERTYQRLVGDASSIRAAVIRDGVQVSGEYSVPDAGGGMTIRKDTGQAFAVLRVTMPVHYETSV